MTTLRSLYNTEPAFGAYSKSVTTAFTIPALSGTATQEFDNVTWVSIGQSVFLSDGTNYGYFKVTVVSPATNTLALENTWGEVDGVTIAIGAKLSPAGVKGAQGVQGVAGVDGADGLDGVDGADGKSAYEIAVEQGFIGDVNDWLYHIVGTDGADGVDGADGSPGLTAYEVAINAGFVGTEEEWLDSLVGPAGPIGPAGGQEPLVSGVNIKTINSESILGSGNLIITGGGDTSSLPNNVRINGVEHFYQTTKPTARGDASALVVGDRWWKTNTRDEWFWNGTYWLSSTRYWAGFNSDQLFNGTAGMNLTPILADHSSGVQPYFLENFHCYYGKQYNNEYYYSATDYWSFYLMLLVTNRDTNPVVALPSSPVITNPRESISPSSNNSFDTINYSINTAFGVSGISSTESYAYLRQAQAVLLKTGSPAPLEGVYLRLNYRYIQL